MSRFRRPTLVAFRAFQVVIAESANLDIAYPPSLTNRFVVIASPPDEKNRRNRQTRSRLVSWFSVTIWRNQDVGPCNLGGAVFEAVTKNVSKAIVIDCQSVGLARFASRS